MIVVVVVAVEMCSLLGEIRDKIRLGKLIILLGVYEEAAAAGGLKMIRIWSRAETEKRKGERRRTQKKRFKTSHPLCCLLSHRK